MRCEHCQSENCKPVAFHLCPSCEGEGCHKCQGSLVPGIVPGLLDEGLVGNLTVCTEYEDPTVDALAFGTMDALIESVTWSRDEMMKDREERADVE